MTSRPWLFLSALLTACAATDVGSVALGQTLEVNTASMSVARYRHTLTTLPNGKVLAVGGGGNGASTATAVCELYDPATATWSSTGALQTARMAHMAVLLPDGTVLVLGGVGASGFLASVERYSPATGTWAAMPPMPRSSPYSTATVLQDGRVVVIGSYSSTPGTAMLFNPTTNVWAQAGTTFIARYDQRATLLADGRVLVTGGAYTASEGNRAEIFDPATGSFAPTALSVGLKAAHRAVRLADGRVLTIADSAPRTEIYNPATNTWSTGPDMPDSSYDQAAIGLSDGSALVTGGAIASIKRFNNGVWSIVGHTAGERSAPSLALLSDGRVLIAGGYFTSWVCTSTGGCSGSPSSIASAELYTNSNASLAVYDSALRAPKCSGGLNECDSGGGLYGRSTLTSGATSNDAELNQPNTLGGTCADGAGGSFYTGSIQAIRVRSANGTALSSGQSVTVQVSVAGGYSSSTPAVVDVFVASDATAPSWQLKSSIALAAPARNGQEVSTTFTLPAGSLEAVRATLRTGGTAVSCSTGALDDHDDLAFVVGGAASDTTAPTVAFTSPTNGGTSTGTVTLSVSASDNVGVTRVDYYNGAALIGGSSSGPAFALIWGCPSGVLPLTAKATDAANNVGTATVTFTCDRVAPSVAITAPATGASVTGSVLITASASDNIAIGRVEFLINGTLVGTDTSAPYEYSWNTAGATGAQSLTARAFDTVGNVTTSASVSVTIGAGGPAGTVATYDATLRAPSCRVAGLSCDSDTLLVGRASVGPESNAPNTLGSTCADGTAGSFHSDESLDRLRVYRADGGPLKVGSVVTIEATVWAWAGYSSDHLDLYAAPNASSPVWSLVATLTPTKAGQGVLRATFTLPSGALQAIRGRFRYGGAASSCSTGSYDDHDDLAFAVAP